MRAAATPARELPGSCSASRARKAARAAWPCLPTGVTARSSPGRERAARIARPPGGLVRLRVRDEPGDRKHTAGRLQRAHALRPRHPPDADRAAGEPGAPKRLALDLARDEHEQAGAGRLAPERRQGRRTGSSPGRRRACSAPPCAGRADGPAATERAPLALSSRPQSAAGSLAVAVWLRGAETPAPVAEAAARVQATTAPTGMSVRALIRGTPSTCWSRRHPRPCAA